MKRSAVWLLAIASACNADDDATGGSGSASESTQSGESTQTSDSTADTSTGDPIGPGPDSGLLACPAGQACTLVAVAEAFDDRVEVYSARGQGPIYRGAIDFDLKPNPMGDNE
ncbi:MAG TPA: hypothetical protein VG755_34010, partial [Nannocystaceae bacterium]|nr:hypothetical protein [Nannocystaceae bacterium]